MYYDYINKLSKQRKEAPMSSNSEGTLPAKARASSLKSQTEFSKMIGVSPVTLCKWEQDPDKWLTVEKLRLYWDNVGLDGKAYLREYVDGIFPEEQQ